MDSKALRRLSLESPFKGERDAAKNKLKILRKKPFAIDLSKPVIFFNKKFKKYRNKWFHIIYDLKDHGIFEVKFLYGGLYRHGGNEFSFITKRLSFKKDGKWIYCPINQIKANDVMEVKINKTGIYFDMKEFLRTVGFSYNKKLPFGLS